MANQRQPFRFRLSWLAPQRPATQPQRSRPAVENPRSPSQPTTSVPIQRPAFRPAGIAPTQPSPKAEPQQPAITESLKTPPSMSTTKPPSQSSVANESQKVDNQSAASSSSSSTTAKPPSPPPAATESPKSPLQSASPSSTVTKPPLPTFVAIESPKSNSQSSSKAAATSKPQSSSRVANGPAQPSVKSPQSPSLGRPQSKVASSTPSPPKGDSKSKAGSASPTTTSQAQQESRNSSLTQSPSRPQKTTIAGASTPRRTTQKEPELKVDIESQSPSSPAKPQNQGSSEPPTSAKKPTSQTSLQESELRVVKTSETPAKTTLQDDAIAEDGREGSRQANVAQNSEEIKAKPAMPQKLNSSSILMRDQKPARGESTGIAGELLKEEKNNNMAVSKEEPMPKTITGTPGTGSKSGVELQAVKTQQKREVSQIKETLSATSYIGKHIKTTSPSQPMEGNASMSFQTPTEEEAPKRREIKEGISRLVDKLTTGSQFDEKQVVVITLTGENRGASMLLSSEQAKKEALIHIHRDYKTNPNETTDEEERTKEKRLDGKASPPATASINSNVQSVNNSIVVEASVTGKDPGVHLVLSQNTSEASKANGESESMETRKAEFTTSHADRLTHEPTVRRRCLRGLFLESSDSEPGNPNKPRRHGCRYSCEVKSRDKRAHVI